MMLIFFFFFVYLYITMDRIREGFEFDHVRPNAFVRESMGNLV